jgi:DNA-binding transcriptional regulator LsrR (DeoR family)
VQISIRPVMGIFDDLEGAVAEKYGLREVIVVETTQYNDHDTVIREIGTGAAEYLLRVLQPREVIVMSWGSSLLHTINSLYATASRSEADGVTVVQGLGGLGDPTNEIHAADLARRLARVLGGQAVLLPAPGIAGTAAAAHALHTDPHVQRAIDQAASATVALMGIGAPRSDSILIRQGTIVSWGELAALQDRGAVGDINLRYFDQDGHLIESGLNDRVIGLTLDQIRQIGTVVGIAGGEAKLKAIQGAVHGKLVDVLVTDDVTARHLLAGT